MADTKRVSSPVEPISEKPVHKASAAEAERAEEGDLPVSPKELARAEGEVPVSGSVEKGDDVVRRNDVEGTIGPVAGPPEPFLSEGVRQDIELRGAATDPVTGRVLTRDDLPKG